MVVSCVVAAFGCAAEPLFVVFAHASTVARNIVPTRILFMSFLLVVDVASAVPHAQQGFSAVSAIQRCQSRSFPQDVHTCAGTPNALPRRMNATLERQRIVAWLNRCIEACVDSERAYGIAAATARDPNLKMLFQSRADERGEFVIGLQHAVTLLGAFPENQGTAR